MMTTTKEIEALSALSQGAAAWMCGVSPRSLRDAPALKREEDGSYNAQTLLAWARSRLSDSELTDSEWETLLVFCECLSLDDSQQPAAIELLTSLREKYGGAVDSLFVDMLLADWQESVEREERRAADPRHRIKQEEYRRLAAEERKAEAQLQIALQCGTCKRVRRGRRWLKTFPPADHKVLAGVCPKCDK